MAADNQFAQESVDFRLPKCTEAAAASAVVVVQMDAGGMPPPPKQMIVDRPFLFMIRDRSTHSVLFVGHVADPTKS